MQEQENIETGNEKAYSKADILVANREVIDMYEQYQDGLITKNEYSSFMIEHLDRFLKRIVSMKFAGHGYGNNFDYEDFVQEGRLAIHSKITEYNPYENMPTTYFGYVIESVLRNKQKDINGDGISAYYKGTIINLDRVAKQYGYEDSLDEKLSDVKLHVLSEISLSTVTKARDLKRRQKVSLDAVGDTLTNESMSPEQSIIKKENTLALAEMLKDIPELDLYILRRMVIDDDCASTKQVIRELSSEEAKERFKLKKNLNTTAIQTNLNRTLLKLKKYDKNFTEYQKRINYDYNSEEQAEESDIFDAFENGDLFDDTEESLGTGSFFQIEDGYI